MNKILLIILLIGLIAFPIQIEQGSSTNNDMFDIEIVGAFKAGGLSGYPIPPNATVTYTIDAPYLEKTGFRLIYNGNSSIFLTYGEIWHIFSAEGESWEYGRETFIINSEMNQSHPYYDFLIETRIYSGMNYIEVVDTDANTYLLTIKTPNSISYLTTWPVNSKMRVNTQTSGFLIIPVVLVSSLLFLRRRR